MRFCTASGPLSPLPLGACCKIVRAAVSCRYHPGSGRHSTALPSLTLAAATLALHGNTSPPAEVSAQIPASYSIEKGSLICCTYLDELQQHVRVAQYTSVIIV